MMASVLQQTLFKTLKIKKKTLNAKVNILKYIILDANKGLMASI